MTHQTSRLCEVSGTVTFMVADEDDFTREGAEDYALPGSIETRRMKAAIWKCSRPS